jgi:TPR repeat protein
VDKKLLNSYDPIKNALINTVRNAIDMDHSTSKEIAFEYFRRSADQGCIAAFTNLGICYQNGEGTRQDLIKAMKNFEISCEEGDANACYLLGMYYLRQGS